MPTTDDDAGSGQTARDTTPISDTRAPGPRGVLLRPEPGETKEEFSARLLAAVMDQRHTSDPDG